VQYYAVILFISIHIFEAFILLVTSFYFCIHQYKKFQSWRLMAQNNFVVVTLALALSLFASELTAIPMVFSVYQLGFASAPTKANDPAYFTVPTAMFEVMVLVCHVTLLHLRTRPIVEHNKSLKTVIKGILAVFSVMTTFCFVSSPLLLLKTERSNGLRNSASESIYDTLVVISSSLCGASMCAMDCVSSFCFLNYVRRAKKGLGTQEHVSTMKSTSLIASIGAIISLTSLSGSSIYALQVFFTDFVTIDGMYAVTTLTMTAVSIMWISMKIQLDKLNTIVENKIDTSGENELPRPSVV
jgi:hypothetical protein